VEDAEEAKVGKLVVGAEAGVGVGLDTISSSPKSSNEGVAAALGFVVTRGEEDTEGAGGDV